MLARPPHSDCHQVPPFQTGNPVRTALNAAGGSADLTGALCHALPKPVDGPLPTVVPYLPAPDANGWIEGFDGRRWRVKDPKALAANFKLKLPIDENHSTELAAKVGGPSPARGWIEGFDVDGTGAINARVTWTLGGAEKIKAGEYGFLSPTFDYRESTREIVRLKSAALTNEPNFALALNSRGAPTQETNMLKKLLAALGLQEDADEQTALNAVGKLKSDLATATNKAATPDPEKFVPKADLVTAVNRANTAEGELKTIKADQHKAKVAAAIDQALADGKITPASKDHYTAICSQEGGLERFAELVKTMPVVVPEDQRVAKNVRDKDRTVQTEQGGQLARAFGNTDADFQKYGS